MIEYKVLLLPRLLPKIRHLQFEFDVRSVVKTADVCLPIFFGVIFFSQRNFDFIFYQAISSKSSLTKNMTGKEDQYRPPTAYHSLPLQPHGECYAVVGGSLNETVDFP
jgi:hypothetical protein